MKPVLVLLRKSLLNFSRARAAIVITFVVPVALIFLFGHVFGLFGHNDGPQHIPLAVVNQSNDPAAKDLVAALKAEKTFQVVDQAKGPDGTMHPLTEAEARAGLHDNAYHSALILPADMVSDDRFGVRMKFLSDPRNQVESQLVNGMLQKVIFSNVPHLLGQSLQRRARSYLGADRYSRFNETIAKAVSSTFGGDDARIRRRIESGDFFSDAISNPPAAPAPGGVVPSGTPVPPPAAVTARPSSDLFSRIVKIDTEQVAGVNLRNATAARTVGGYAIMFLLFAVSGSASTMFEERESGVFQRLLSCPVQPSHILWSRFLFGMILGLVQIGAMFLAGWVFFGLEIFAHFVPLLAVASAAAAACSAFGMLVVAISPSSDAANGIATFVVISMSAVGGAWFPISIMPHYIQSLSKCTVVYWSVEGFLDVLWAGRSLWELLPKIGILAAIAGVVLAFSIWRFNRTRFFE